MYQKKAQFATEKQSERPENASQVAGESRGRVRSNTDIGWSLEIREGRQGDELGSKAQFCRSRRTCRSSKR